MSYVGNAIVVGWRDLYGRSQVRWRRDGSLVGYVRLAGDRWFPEWPDQFPIAGTFRTRSLAIDALLAERSRCSDSAPAREVAS